MKLDRITTNPNRLNGQPCIRDLRLTVRRVLEILLLYPVRAELRQKYPELEDEDICQALAYAAASLDNRVVELAYEERTAAECWRMMPMHRNYLQGMPSLPRNGAMRVGF